MENKTILNIILIGLLVIYVFFFTYLIVRYVIPKNKAEGESRKAEEQPKDSGLKITNNSQTEFYKKSVEHAEKVLFEKSFDPQYGEANFYGNKLIDAINKINNETKQSVILAIKYFSIEPAQARANEQLFRMMSEQEKVPLWFIILRTATKKVLPDFSIDSNQQPVQNNIVPLYQKTG